MGKMASKRLRTSTCSITSCDGSTTSISGSYGDRNKTMNKGFCYVCIFVCLIWNFIIIIKNKNNLRRKIKNSIKFYILYFRTYKINLKFFKYGKDHNHNYNVYYDHY